MRWNTRQNQHLVGPLPCHLQNEVNISGYIIQYTHLPTGVSRNISSSDTLLECHQEPGGPYSCLVRSSFFIPGVTYSFQVAVDNVHGIGSFSDPVTIIMYGSQGKFLLLILLHKAIVNQI